MNQNNYLRQLLGEKQSCGASGKRRGNTSRWNVTVIQSSREVRQAISLVSEARACMDLRLRTEPVEQINRSV